MQGGRNMAIDTLLFAVVFVTFLGHSDAYAAKCAFTVQPGGMMAAGVAFGTQPVVEIQDATGFKVADSTVNVVMSKASGPGTLSGTLTVAAQAGVATFTNLKIDTAGAHVLTATPTSLTAANSDSITIYGAANKGAFTTQPGGAMAAGVAFGTQPVVAIQDATGTTVTDSTVEVVMTKKTGWGTLSGTTTMNAVAGVATFTDLKIDTAGAHVLTAIPAGLTAADSSSFTVTFGAANEGAFTTPPPPPPMPYLTIHTPFTNTDTKITFAFKTDYNSIYTGDQISLQLPQFILTHTSAPMTTQGCGTSTFVPGFSGSTTTDASITFKVATTTLHSNTACTITTPEGMVKTPSNAPSNESYQFRLRYNSWTHIPAAQSTALMTKLDSLASSKLRIDNPLVGARSSFTFTFQYQVAMPAQTTILLTLPLWELSTAGPVTSTGCTGATIASIQNSGEADASITFMLHDALAVDMLCSITTSHETAKLPLTSQPTDLNTRTVQIFQGCPVTAVRAGACSGGSIPTAIESSTGTFTVMPGSKAPRSSPGKCTQMAPDEHRVSCPEAHGGFVWSCEREWASGFKASWECLSEDEAQDVLQRDI